MMPASLWIKASPGTGTSVEVAVGRAIDLARRVGVGVEMDFNGIPVLVTGRDRPADVVAEYDRENEKRCSYRQGDGP